MTEPTVVWMLTHNQQVVYVIPVSWFDGTRLPLLDRFVSMVSPSNDAGDDQAWIKVEDEAACQQHWQAAVPYYEGRVQECRRRHGGIFPCVKFIWTAYRPL